MNKRVLACGVEIDMPSLKEQLDSSELLQFLIRELKS